MDAYLIRRETILTDGVWLATKLLFLLTHEPKVDALNGKINQITPLSSGMDLNFPFSECKPRNYAGIFTQRESNLGGEKRGKKLICLKWTALSQKPEGHKMGHFGGKMFLKNADINCFTQDLQGSNLNDEFCSEFFRYLELPVTDSQISRRSNDISFHVTLIAGPFPLWLFSIPRSNLSSTFETERLKKNLSQRKSSAFNIFSSFTVESDR